MLLTVDSPVSEGGERGAEDLQACRMRRGDQVLVPGDDLRGGRQGEVDVVDPFEHDDVPGSGQGHRVTQEAGLRADTEDNRVGQDPVAADALVDDRMTLSQRAGQEPPGQVVRPPVVGADGGTPAVGDGIPERDDRTAGRGADLNVDLVEAPESGRLGMGRMAARGFLQGSPGE